MSRSAFAEMDCSIARTLDVVGERWSLLILRDAFYGVRRFDDFRRDLGIARNVLTDRLGKLVDQGVLERRRYEQRPPRFEYRLTVKGRDLLPVLLAMVRWGDHWAAREEPPVELTHTPCGHITEPTMACSHCRRELTWRDLRAHPIRIPAFPRE